ncbi:MAG: glycerol-3-phosphate acyltransferase, partial [Micrococcales bacterium]|nr:glycerol-3-phosphate acyltransferase [Micrococcales bacterium]
MTVGGALGLLVVAVVAFLIGAVNPATLVARALGVDLRGAGSGNPGATNAGRVLGRKWGVLVLVLDVAKAYLPTLLALWRFGLWAALVAGLAVVLGHVFSPFLRGHGGKGVACALGAILAVAPLVALVALVVFGV